MIGIDSWKDAKWGVLAGLLFIGLASYSSLFRIGIPTVALAFETVSKVLIIVFLAPILEEIFFRGIIFSILKEKFSLWVGLLGSAISFSLFHALAYGDVLTMSGAFVGAGLFGLITGLITYKTKNVLPGIIMHGMVNAYLIQVFVIGM